jgi:D-xylose transport system permease protein
MSEARTEPDLARELEADHAAVAAAEEQQGFRNPLKALAQGELGSVRVIIVLAIIWIIFQTQNDRFLSSINLTNLMLQIAAVGTISIGVTLVLLLGEIDLSVGSVSGVCASITAVLSVKNGWDPTLAIFAGLAAGAGIGLFNAFFICVLGVPSFVVTLAGLLGWLGLQLAVLGDTGTVNLPLDTTITNLAGTFFSKGVGWILALAGVAAFIAVGLNERIQRSRAGLPLGDVKVLIAKNIAVAAALIAAVYVLNDDRGVPRSAVILVVLCGLMAFLTTRTSWGRHLYATGGNEEAARRAGINTTWVRMSVFILASTFAAAGGILAASRLLAVNQTSGGSDLLLFAIAGPVVAGVSLFGGRGTLWAALLGALVIGSIQNGMDLLALKSQDKYMITGAVLLLAITFDALTSKRRAQTRR